MERASAEQRKWERQVDEAVLAGRRALESLRLAQKSLNSARRWGFFDMLGGGFFSGLIKHDHMDEASDYMDEACEELERFRRELGDISMERELRIDVGSVLSFMDLFMDNIFSDYMVQAEIDEALDYVEEAAVQVGKVLEELERM